MGINWKRGCDSIDPRGEWDINELKYVKSLEQCLVDSKYLVILSLTGYHKTLLILIIKIRRQDRG